MWLDLAVQRDGLQCVSVVLLNLLVTIKAAPYECVIRTGLPYTKVKAEHETRIYFKVTVFLSKDEKHITLSLKHQQNNYIKNGIFSISIETNRVDLDQTAPTSLIWVHTVCLLGFKYFSGHTKNIRLFVICALRVNTCEVSVYTVRIFLKCTHVCAAQTTCKLFTKL